MDKTSPVSTWSFAISLVLAVSVCALGGLANGVVLLTMARTPSLRVHAANGLVACLCIADLLALLTHLPLFLVCLAWTHSDHPPPPPVCALQGAFDACSTAAQMLSLAALTYERFRAVADPFEVPEAKWRRVKAGMTAAWLASGLLAGLTVGLVARQGTTGLCPNGQSLLSTLWIFMPLGAATVLFVSACYIRMMVLLRAHNRALNPNSDEETRCFSWHAFVVAVKRALDRRCGRLHPDKGQLDKSGEAATQTQVNVEIPDDAGKPPESGIGLDVIPVVDRNGAVVLQRKQQDNQFGAICVIDPRARAQSKRRLEARTALRSLGLVLGFLVLWLPLPVLVLTLGSGQSSQWTPLYRDLETVAMALGLATAALNPLLYGLAIRQFRVAFKTLLRKWGRKK